MTFIERLWTWWHHRRADPHSAEQFAEADETLRRLVLAARELGIRVAAEEERIAQERRAEDRP